MKNKSIGEFSPAVIPITAGVSLKPQHFNTILERKPEMGWFEIHPENYFVDGGPMLHNLARIREHYPISFHGVGLSLGGAVVNKDARINKENHLGALKQLIDRFEPGLISEHLAWSNWNDISLNDLLPVQYTEEAFRLMSENVDRVQTFIGRNIGIENPSSYINFSTDEMQEYDFLVRLAKETGASILLDVNNVFVSAFNHGWDANEYIDKIPAELVTEIHLAGHSKQESIAGNILIDDHGSTVCESVWDLYQYTLTHLGRKPTLIEWDTNVPEWEVLKDEANKANILLSCA